MTEHLEPLDEECRALVTRERHREGPGREVEDRALRRMELLLALERPPVTEKPRLGRPTTLRFLRHPAALLAAALAVGTALGATGHAVITKPAPLAPPAPSSPPSSVTARALGPAVPMTAPAPPPPETSAPDVAPSAPSESAKPRGIVRDAELAKERQLLEVARTAVARSAPQDALVPLREHRTRFPNGALAEERDALVIQALAQSGHEQEAEAQRRVFLGRYPHSLFLPRVGSGDAAP